MRKLTYVVVLIVGLALIVVVSLRGTLGKQTAVITYKNQPCPPVCPDKKPTFAYRVTTETIHCPPFCPDTKSLFPSKDVKTGFPIIEDIIKQ